jgi:hypothetical protein
MNAIPDGLLKQILFADFLILFFTEALFYGVGIFVLLIDKAWRPLQQVAPKSYIWSKSRFFLYLFSDNNGSELDNTSFDNGHGL